MRTDTSQKSYRARKNYFQVIPPTLVKNAMIQMVNVFNIKYNFLLLEIQAHLPSIQMAFKVVTIRCQEKNWACLRFKWLL